MNQIITTNADHHIPWNKGKLIGQKSPLKLKEIWAIRIRLQLTNRTRELALFNLAIDSKLRGCDLVKLRVGRLLPGWLAGLIVRFLGVRLQAHQAVGCHP